MLNPITIMVMILVLTFCLIFSITYKIPTSSDYTATVTATTTREVYENFMNSTSDDIDTKSALDELLSKAQNYLDIQTENESEEFTAISNIKNEFETIRQQLERYAIDGNSSYLNSDDTNNFYEIEDASQSLDEFVTTYKSLDVFESRLFINQEDFEELELLNDYIKSTLNNEEYLSIKESNTYKYITCVLDDFVENIDLFSIVLQAQINLIGFDPEKIETFQSQYIAKAEAKLEEILKEMETLDISVGSSTDYDEMVSLITNYKLTCESAYAGVTYELYLLLLNHFGDIDELYKCEDLIQEDLKQSLVTINYFLDDESVYYTSYQAPLNFNIATSSEKNAYDYTYLILCIIGFFTIIFGIFCAYKLFGLDRRNGKMDIVLSQDVRFGQVFAGKFLAIVFCTSFVLSFYTLLTFLWTLLFNPTVSTQILAVFNLSTAYTIHPILFLLIKLIGFELQVIFYAVITIFIMNLSRKFELNFAISLLLFVVATICNIFLNSALVYCLFPFIHADLTALLGGGIMSAGFLQTALYTYGNFFISLVYYLVVVVLLYNFTNQLFKKN